MPHPARSRPRIALFALLVLVTTGAPAAWPQELRLATWNVTYYGASSHQRDPDFQHALYAEFQGRRLAPDLLVCQEFLDAGAVANFLELLNTAPDSPGDWQAAPFLDGPDSDSALFFRAGKVAHLGTSVVSWGSPSPAEPPRNTYRYDLRLIEDPAAPLLCLYSVHMKAGASSQDQARRLVEAQRIREDAAALPQGASFVVAGDFNIAASSQAAYQALVGGASVGRVFDPIGTPGRWSNNAAFRFVHTQDPAGAGGVDDRYDQILLSGDLLDGAGWDYRGDASVPYNTSGWDDAAHSYRVWGNDGSSFNASLTVAGNEMVGETIAASLVRAAYGAGHLPVYLDLFVADPPPAGRSEHEPGSVLNHFARARAKP